MILTGRDIKWYIDSGKLKISPITEIQFQQNGVDLILQELDQDWLVKQVFTLGRTREFIEMPDDLMAFVELRSTWARSGLIIPPTIVDAGFKGTLTLEILPCRSMKPPLGERFAHLIFAKLSNPSEPYNGKYQHQIEITPAIPDKKKE